MDEQMIINDHSAQSQNPQDAQPAQAAEPIASQTDVRYAGFWIRFLALIIDGLVLAVPTGILEFFKIPFVGVAVGWIYAIFMLNYKQATLGKMALGLKVTTTSGEKPEIGKIILRETVGKLVSGIILCIGYLMVAFTKKKQGLHDMIADTVVIHDPARKK